ncbi:45801_t:CDS:2, partial [Gigaspora margarita]
PIDIAMPPEVKQKIEKNLNLSPMDLRTHLHTIGFTTSLLLASHYTKIHCDATYRTAKGRFELYGIVGNVEGTADRLQQLLLGRVVPSWFDEFKKQWNNLLTKPLNNIEDRYFIDLEHWICSCPSFFQSRFLICKHLIYEASDNVKPESIRLIYQNFKRQTDYPFLIWNSSELQIVSENNEDYTINNPINNIIEPYDTNKSYEHIATIHQRLEPKVAALQHLIDHVNEEFSANNL